ncbi:Mycocerosic acid synthase [Raoultella terrigena]|uniref:Mycocerosic acid synthase n=1 Tax=Raoultella terrigena TaxID=577 RepID=A0A485BH94_RAOTE|nr:Mycocerosic acid synthase [Raoultella terrigena]
MPLPEYMNEVEITSPGGPEVLRVRKAPLPLPGPDEVLVHVAAAGVNRPDVIQRQGKYPMPDGVTPVPGLEVAGNIVAIGDNVTDWAIGDKVCGLTNGGGYAEYCLLPATAVPAGPDGREHDRGCRDSGNVLYRVGQSVSNG